MVTLTIPNMTCGACEKRVRKALEPVGGITGIKVDLPSHTVDVVGALDPAQVTVALQKAGYPPLEA